MAACSTQVIIKPTRTKKQTELKLRAVKTTRVETTRSKNKQSWNYEQWKQTELINVGDFSPEIRHWV